uniref:Uncharacterized protein n=1 Tax=Plectus sambesii TaxID=2011161 RepID=A0A914VEI4_9BILA
MNHRLAASAKRHAHGAAAAYVRDRSLSSHSAAQPSSVVAAAATHRSLIPSHTTAHSPLSAHSAQLLPCPPLSPCRRRLKTPFPRHQWTCPPAAVIGQSNPNDTETTLAGRALSQPGRFRDQAAPTGQSINAAARRLFVDRTRSLDPAKVLRTYRMHVSTSRIGRTSNDSFNPCIGRSGADGGHKQATNEINIANSPSTNADGAIGGPDRRRMAPHSRPLPPWKTLEDVGRRWEDATTQTRRVSQRRKTRAHRRRCRRRRRPCEAHQPAAAEYDRVQQTEMKPPAGLAYSSNRDKRTILSTGGGALNAAATAPDRSKPQADRKSSRTAAVDAAHGSDGESARPYDLAAARDVEALDDDDHE